MRLATFVCVLLLTCFSANAQTLDRGNEEARDAFNAALLELWSDGTYDNIYSTWFGIIPERFTDCPESSVALQYPTNPTPNGLLDNMISSGSVTFGYVAGLASLPSFQVTDGQITGGFYPRLGEAILDRIRAHYSSRAIQIEWFANTDPGMFYDQHVEGTFDVGFLSLFKNGVWNVNGNVVGRPDIWNFSCGLASTAPIRYYICPSARDSGIDLTSVQTIDSPSTSVGFFGGGAQETLSRARFPNSDLQPFNDLNNMISACRDGDLDIMVELPARVTDQLDDAVEESRPLGTYNNSGAAFRKDAQQTCNVNADDDDDNSSNDDDDDSSSNSNTNSNDDDDDSSGAALVLPFLGLAVLAVI